MPLLLLFEPETSREASQHFNHHHHHQDLHDEGIVLHKEKQHTKRSTNFELSLKNVGFLGSFMLVVKKKRLKGEVRLRAGRKEWTKLKIKQLTNIKSKLFGFLIILSFKNISN